MNQGLPSGMQMMLKGLGIDPEKALANITALQNTGLQIIQALERLDKNVTEFRAEQERLTAHIAQLMENDNGRNQHEQSDAANANSGSKAGTERGGPDAANANSERGGPDA